MNSSTNLNCPIPHTDLTSSDVFCGLNLNPFVFYRIGKTGLWCAISKSTVRLFIDLFNWLGSLCSKTTGDVL